MTDEERFFYELGRKSYYGDREYSRIKQIEQIAQLIERGEFFTNRVNFDDLNKP